MATKFVQMSSRARRAGCLILLCVGVAVPPAAQAATAGCVARKAPVELETLHLDFATDQDRYRVGSQVLVSVTVTRLGEKGSLEAQAGGAAPLAFATVEGLVTSRGAKLSIAAQETDQEGRARLRFNLPKHTAAGPVDIAATVRYVTVDSLDCTGPVLVETGEGRRAGLFTAVR